MEPVTDPTIPAPPAQVTVVVAHADAGRCDQLARWLESDGRFVVLGRAGDAGAATASVVSSVPDLAFVDVDLGPGPSPTTDPTADPTPTPTSVVDGIAAIELLTERRPSVRLIAVTDHDDDRAYTAMLAGAIGCYQWDAPASWRPVWPGARGR